ncbi:MAG: hypothetical protein ACRYFR_14530 [Janthinobacterium lividum]
MKAPIFRAYVHRATSGTDWNATVTQPQERSRYGRPSRLPLLASTRAEALYEAAEFARVYQTAPDMDGPDDHQS